ncbi:unnamed protein product [Thlaspi arvense]|uniref:Uncharacterized protein n=1 Tax=Thlaspi arvense TaxID=13288 RepID=A0AAU9RH00_THLAR|nr:unnamed protein product [Thlaspi arvense]
MGILVGCGFSGTIPDAIGSLKQLRRHTAKKEARTLAQAALSLNSNCFSGKIPPSIGNLSNLYWLDLADNKISGTIPVSDGKTMGLDMLLKARHLRLDGNALSGPVPSNLNNLTDVNEMFLSNNQLTGPLPNLTGMNLSYVDMSNNTFDATDFPLWLSTLTYLTTVYASPPPHSLNADTGMHNTGKRNQFPIAARKLLEKKKKACCPELPDLITSNLSPFLMFLGAIHEKKYPNLTLAELAVGV